MLVADAFSRTGTDDCLYFNRRASLRDLRSRAISLRRIRSATSQEIDLPVCLASSSPAFHRFSSNACILHYTQPPDGIDRNARLSLVTLPPHRLNFRLHDITAQQRQITKRRFDAGMPELIRHVYDRESCP